VHEDLGFEKLGTLEPAAWGAFNIQGTVPRLVLKCCAKVC